MRGAILTKVYWFNSGNGPTKRKTSQRSSFDNSEENRVTKLNPSGQMSKEGQRTNYRGSTTPIHTRNKYVVLVLLPTAESLSLFTTEATILSEIVASKSNHANCQQICHSKKEIQRESLKEKMVSKTKQQK